MKKILSVFVLALVLASCGDSTETAGDNDSDSTKNDVESSTTEVDPVAEDESNYSSDEDEMETSDESSASDEWNEVLDGYEDYVSDYVAIIKKQKEDPSDMTIMNEYLELMQKGTAWTTKMSEMSSDFGVEQVTRMLEIQSKLATAAL